MVARYRHIAPDAFSKQPPLQVASPTLHNLRFFPASFDQIAAPMRAPISDIFEQHLSTALCQKVWCDYGKDVRETLRHQENVAQIADDIAVHMNLPIPTRRNLYTASMLHDMGKFSLDPTLLFHKGRFDEGMHAEMASHPMASASLIQEQDLLKNADLIAHIASQHHECLDGTGYPYKLQSDQILMESRILTVADVYDALVSARCYKKAKTPDCTLSIMADDVGSKYDPAVFEALIDSQDAARFYETPPHPLITDSYPTCPTRPASAFTAEQPRRPASLRLAIGE